MTTPGAGQQPADTVTARPEQHLFVDRHARNLCDVCDRWSGAPVHAPIDYTDVDMLTARVMNAESTEEARYWHELLDKATSDEATSHNIEATEARLAEAERLLRAWENGQGSLELAAETRAFLARPAPAAGGKW